MNTAVAAIEAPRPKGLWTLLGRHQLAALASTAVDFGVMIAAVELLGRSPAGATLVGAVCGGITNFQLGRRWIFDAQHERAAPQAVRYALVSAGCAALNALGEYVGHDVLKVDYVAARVVVSGAVSLLWSFPMQRWFVFRRPRSAPPAGGSSGRA